MIQVKKKYQGKNIKLHGRPKFTLGIEVDYSTAFAMNEGGLGDYLIKEKKVKKEKKFEAIEQPKEDGEE